MVSDAPREARSIFGVDALDEFAVYVADWIWGHCNGLANVEIEAKIGTLVDRNTDERLRFPVLTETIIDAKALGVRFESNMSMEQHRRYNLLLNELVSYSGNLLSSEQVQYSHKKEIDAFYDERDDETGKTVHLRVTRDANTSEIKPNGVVRKQRIADLNIYSPNRPFDFRISINTETPMPPPPENSVPSFVREKNRLSYTHQNSQTDLTQVSLPKRRDEPLHELEVEVRDPMQLLQLAYDTKDGSGSTDQVWTPYEDAVLVLLNTIRLLIRNADSFS